jgi:acyl-coenzyme A thioesterase PaaI-like protein
MEGPFWDVMEGRVAPPPAAVLLGWELVAVDPAAGTIEVAFTASDQFLNPAGVIQGGFLAGELLDSSGQLVATAVATAAIRTFRRLPAVAVHDLAERPPPGVAHRDQRPVRGVTE